MISLDIVIKVLEGLSYLCAVGILIIAIKGLSQITVARKSLSLSSKRDALRVTNTQVQSFFQVIMPAYENQRLTSAESKLVQSTAVDENGNFDFKKIRKKNVDGLGGHELRTKNGRRLYEHDVTVAFEKKTTIIQHYRGIFELFHVRTRRREICIRGTRQGVL